MVRIKHRYLLINILYPVGQATQLKVSAAGLPDLVHFHQPTSTNFSHDMLRRLIRDGVTELFGDYGAGMIAGSLKVMYLSTATSTAIIRVSRESYRLVWAALSFATKLPNPLSVPCVIQVLRVSGTIKKSEEATIQYATETLRRTGAISGSAVGATGISQTGTHHEALSEVYTDAMDVDDIGDSSAESDTSDA